MKSNLQCTMYIPRWAWKLDKILRHATVAGKNSRSTSSALTGSHKQKKKYRFWTDGNVFFLKGHAGTGKTYLLLLLRDMVEVQDMFVEICATTGIAASLYKSGWTLQNWVDVGFEDKDSSERHAWLPKYGPRSQKAKFIRSLPLIIIHEVSTTQRLLIEHIDIIIKDFRCLIALNGIMAGGMDRNNVLELPKLPYYGGLTCRTKPHSTNRGHTRYVRVWL